MNNIDCKIIDKTAEKLSFIWTLTCLTVGMIVLNVVFKNNDLSYFISLLMPLYFIIWFLFVVSGHMVIRRFFKTDFYTSTIFGGKVFLQILKLPKNTISNISWDVVKNANGTLPRKTSIMLNHTSYNLTFHRCLNSCDNENICKKPYLLT